MLRSPWGGHFLISSLVTGPISQSGHWLQQWLDLWRLQEHHNCFWSVSIVYCYEPIYHIDLCTDVFQSIFTADFLDMISRDQVLWLSIDRNSLWLLWNWSWQVLVNSSYINSAVWSVSHRQDLTSLSTSPVPRTGSLKETPTFVGQLGLTLKPAHSTCYQRRRIDAVSFRWVVKFCGGDTSH